MSFFTLTPVLTSSRELTLMLHCVYFLRVCVCPQRYINGVFGQRDRSSGVSAVGGVRPDSQGEDRQGSGSAESSDRSVAETTLQLLMSKILNVT